MPFLYKICTMVPLLFLKFVLLFAFLFLLFMLNKHAYINSYITCLQFTKSHTSPVHLCPDFQKHPSHSSVYVFVRVVAGYRIYFRVFVYHKVIVNGFSWRCICDPSSILWLCEVVASLLASTIPTPFQWQSRQFFGFKVKLTENFYLKTTEIVLYFVKMLMQT